MGNIRKLKRHAKKIRMAGIGESATYVRGRIGFMNARRVLGKGKGRRDMEYYRSYLKLKKRLKE